LLLPLSLGLFFWNKFQILDFKFQKKSQFFPQGPSAILNSQFWRILYFLLTGIALFLTFSRAAWIGAAVIILTACWMLLRGQTRRIVCSFFVCSFFVGVIVLALVAPQLLLKGISSSQHLERMQQGIAAILEQPLGRGLGSAGPATNRTSDACLFFEEDADISWAKDRTDLCLFVGDAQVHPLPSEKVCECPLLPESWYLQVGVELGVLGFALFVALTLSVIRLLVSSYWFLVCETNQRPTTNDQLPTFLVFLGVSIAALFLHSWEDSAVAYTVWGITGIALAESSSCSWLSRFRMFFARRCHC